MVWRLSTLRRTFPERTVQRCTVHDACESRTEKDIWTLFRKLRAKDVALVGARVGQARPRTAWKAGMDENRSRNRQELAEREDSGSLKSMFGQKSPINFVSVGPAGVEPCFSRDNLESMVPKFLFQFRLAGRPYDDPRCSNPAPSSALMVSQTRRMGRALTGMQFTAFELHGHCCVHAISDALDYHSSYSPPKFATAIPISY